MEDGGALQIACCLVGTDTSSGAIHATMVPDSKRMDMPNVVARTAKWVRDLGYERFLSTWRQKQEFFSCCWTEWQKKFVLKDKMGRFYDKCHRHRAIRAMEPRRKAVSTVRGLARKLLAVLIDNIPSCEVTIRSPILPWTIRHAACVLTRDTVRRDTRMTTFWKIRGQKYREEILPLQVLARRPVAKVNQLFQQWVTGFWLGRDTLSEGHLMGTAAWSHDKSGSPPSPRTSTMGARRVDINALFHCGHI